MIKVIDFVELWYECEDGNLVINDENDNQVLEIDLSETDYKNCEDYLKYADYKVIRFSADYDCGNPILTIWVEK